MEDTISRSSLDSASEEFVLVNAEPRLKIANNGDVKELEKKLSEVLGDDKDSGKMAANETNELKMESQPKRSLEKVAVEDHPLKEIVRTSEANREDMKSGGENTCHCLH